MIVEQENEIDVCPPFSFSHLSSLYFFNHAVLLPATFLSAAVVRDLVPFHPILQSLQTWDLNNSVPAGAQLWRVSRLALKLMVKP